MNANSALSEYPDLGTQLIAYLLYVAPQLAMHNLVSHQAGGPMRGVASHSFFAFGKCWKCCEKDMDILSQELPPGTTRRRLTMLSATMLPHSQRSVPFRSSGHLSSVIWLLDCRLAVINEGAGGVRGTQLNRALNTWRQPGQLGHLSQ